MSLDKIFRERESLNVGIVEAINKASAAWGITCLRYEIRDIKVSALTRLLKNQFGFANLYLQCVVHKKRNDFILCV